MIYFRVAELLYKTIPYLRASQTTLIKRILRNPTILRMTRKMSVNGNDVQFTDKAVYMTRTLAMVKPDAIERSDEIEEVILQHGFVIVEKRRVHLTPEQTSDFYAEHYGKMFFPSLVAYISSGPLIALVLAREDAISYWRQLIGPTNTLKARDQAPESLRAIYGTDSQRNALHGSDSQTNAEREIHFFFPNCIVEPVSYDQAAKDYLSRAVNTTLITGLTELCKKKPADPILWLADWLIENNPNKPVIKQPAYRVDEPED